MSGNIDYNLNLEENADFKGLYSYKLFLPIVMAAYYIVIFAAPFAPSYVYHILYITLAFNTVNMVFLVIRMTSATRQVVKNALLEKHCDEESLIGIASNFRYQHVFVIPNYNGTYYDNSLAVSIATFVHPSYMHATAHQRLLCRAPLTTPSSI